MSFIKFVTPQNQVSHEPATFTQFLMNPKNWWLPLVVIFAVSIAGVIMIGTQTYTVAPPIPHFISTDGTTLITKDEILKG